MRVLGAALLLAGAGWYCLARRREECLRLRLARALREDLLALRTGVCLRRDSLPRILEELGRSPARALWDALAAGLREEGVLPWTRALEALPEPLGGILAPLGPLLAQGGGELAGAIEEAREELSGFLRTERERQAERSRVRAALSLAGACLAILVLI